MSRVSLLYISCIFIVAVAWLGLYVQPVSAGICAKIVAERTAVVQGCRPGSSPKCCMDMSTPLKTAFCRAECDGGTVEVPEASAGASTGEEKSKAAQKPVTRILSSAKKQEGKVAAEDTPVIESCLGEDKEFTRCPNDKSSAFQSEVKSYIARMRAKNNAIKSSSEWADALAEILKVGSTEGAHKPRFVHVQGMGLFSNFVQNGGLISQAQVISRFGMGSLRSGAADTNMCIGYYVFCRLPVGQMNTGSYSLDSADKIMYLIGHDVLEDGLFFAFNGDTGKSQKGLPTNQKWCYPKKSLVDTLKQELTGMMKLSGDRLKSNNEVCFFDKINASRVKKLAVLDKEGFRKYVSECPSCSMAKKLWGDDWFDRMVIQVEPTTPKASIEW